MSDIRATFVMPHWTADIDLTKRDLEQSLESIFAQTDNDWNLIIVDDCSPCIKSKTYLQNLSEKHKSQLSVIFSDQNKGPGLSRNLGVLEGSSKRIGSNSIQ